MLSGITMKILLCIFLTASAYAAETLTLPLWPEGAPGKMLPHSEFTEAFIKKHQSKNTLTDIAEPTITVFRPAKPNGTSVIVAPGGGFVFLSAVHEGTQVCEWLNTLGVTAILLKYRTPTRDEKAMHEKPVQDAQRALQVVREHAKEWQLNPQRVGLLGFSAGGNLLAHLACDRGSEKLQLPDFGVMIYGGGFLNPKNPYQLAPGFTVPSDAPPLFILCAHDDGTNPIASTLLYLEYKKRDIPAELHFFTQGGHGFGMRKGGKPINEWPLRTAEWMNSMGWLPNVAELDAQIQHSEKKLATVIQILKEGFGNTQICGNDMLRIQKLPSIEAELSELRKGNDQAKIKDLEACVVRERLWVATVKKQLAKPMTMTPETLIDDINSMKRQVLELQAKRARLMGSSPK
jgi:acetyl esterase/lipase